jgi:hypothetical protein
MHKYLVVLMIVIGVHGAGLAQNVPDQITAGDAIELKMPQVALIDTDHAQIVMTLTTSTAGQSIATSVSNSDMWIKVTSVVPGGTHREIKARITGTLPAGTTLSLQAAPATSGNSAGNLGTPVASPITLSTVDQYLIHDIKSCYTGTGPNDGYNLTYTWALTNPANFGSVEAQPSTMITVYFTLTESNSAVN